MKSPIIAFLSVLLAFFSFAAISKEVVYTVDGKRYAGHWQSGKKGKPTVLLLHDWDGLTDYEVKRSDMLKELGFSVFSADLFGEGIRPTEVKDRRQHTGELYKNREKMRKLMNGAIAAAVKQGASKKNMIAMGYCFGGAATLELARSGSPLKGFVTFHGGLKTPEGQTYQATKGELLVFHGTADDNITMEHFADLAKELHQHNVKHEMITYGGAPHAFTVFGSDRYRKDADQKSWNQFIAFLKKFD